MVDMANNTVPFLVISQNPYIRGILKFTLETLLHANVKELESEEKALLYLRDLTMFPGMIIYDYQPDAYLLEDFIVYLETNFKDIKIIILVDKIREESKELLKDTTQFRLLDKNELPENLIKEAEKVFLDQQFENTSEYCKIELRFLSILDGVNKNLYIKLGKDKFVKLFDEDDDTQTMDFQKYRDKGVDYFYITRETAMWIIDQIKKQISLFLRSNNFRFILRGANESAEKRFEQKILRMNDEVHIDKEYRAMVDQAVERIRNVIEKDVDVGQLINYLKAHNETYSYYVQKRNATALIACTLARELDWFSKMTIDKLIYAAALSDITMAIKPHLIRIRTLEELERKKDHLKPEEYRLYLNHPKEGAELIKNYFSSSPPETEMLAYQHHELPDGSGFPLGLKAERISPLSALFIVANHFTDYYLNDDEPNIGDYILKAESRFDYSTFRKVLKALQALKKIK